MIIMTFIQKILDTLNMDNWGKSESEDDERNEPEIINYHSQIQTGFYNDRFYADYRPVMQKKIAFTGNNFSEPAVEVCATLIISGSVKRGEKIKPNDYYSYFERLYGVVDM